MLETAIIAVVLVLMLAETVRGFLMRRSGGLKDAFVGLLGAIPCLAYLIRPHVSESFLLGFLLVGVAVAGGGFFTVARRSSSADSGSSRSPNDNKGGNKTLLAVFAVLLADALAIVVIITTIGHAALVIGSFLVINLVAVVVSSRLPARLF